MRECNFVIRPAGLKDTDFLVEVIVQAEQSGTDKLGLATLFGLTEEEVRKYLQEMLEEEIDGCEFSVSSFLIAEADHTPVAAIGGWIEGQNEDGMPSALLKSNLLGYVLLPENLNYIRHFSELIRDIQIDRETGTYQIEYVYVVPEFRGSGLTGQLLEAHLRKGCLENKDLRKMQVQAFANNPGAVRAYEKAGFAVTKEYRAKDNAVLNYLPGDVKLLLEKIIN